MVAAKSAAEKTKSRSRADNSGRPAPRAAKRLLAWYDRNHRSLPWRAPPGQLQDPYKVWLSEIMLQQTTVSAVKSYYEEFLRLWPDMAALAAAPIDDIMKAWAGLGYYSRARNLHACAKTVISDHDGCLPDDEAALRKLPGIGAYTSAAIAAIAFGKRSVVVDANIERVVARLFEISDPLPKAKPQIRDRTDGMTPKKRAGDFAQAMMDLGATICSVRNPSCTLCPLQSGCNAFAKDTMERYPLKAPKAEKPLRKGAVFLLHRDDGKVLMRTRPPRGLLGGMSEFPGTEWSTGFKLPQSLDHAPLEAVWKKVSGHVEHIFTHFALHLTVYLAQVPRGTRAPKQMRWIAKNKVADEALPTLMRKVWTAGNRN